MAIGRTLPHRSFKPGPRHRADAARHMEWRPVVLIVAALLAAALATYSLLIDPPDSPPPETSYLPSR